MPPRVTRSTAQASVRSSSDANGLAKSSVAAKRSKVPKKQTVLNSSPLDVDEIKEPTATSTKSTSTKSTSTKSTSTKSTSTKSTSTKSTSTKSTSTKSTSTKTNAPSSKEDDEVAILKARITQLTAQLDKQQKAEAAIPKEPATDLIPKPEGRRNSKKEIRTAMGLSGDDDELYSACRHAVRKAMIKVGLNTELDWRNQDRQLVLRVMELANEGAPLLKKYQQGWAAEDIMVTMCRNARNYQSKKKRGYFKKKEGGDEGEAVENDEEVVEIGGDENKPRDKEEENTEGSESESDINASESDKEMEDGEDDGVDEEARKAARRTLKRSCEDDEVILRKVGREKRRKS